MTSTKVTSASQISESIKPKIFLIISLVIIKLKENAIPPPQDAAGCHESPTDRRSETKSDFKPSKPKHITTSAISSDTGPERSCTPESIQSVNENRAATKDAANNDDYAAAPSILEVGPVMQHPISNACASKSSHNHFQHHHDSQNEDESRKGQTSKKGHAKVATKTDYDQSGNRFNNNISCIKKFKDALQMLGISYNDYGSIVTFEDSELKETIKHQLNSAKLFQLLKLFEFLNGNPILVNEYCSNVDAYTGDKFVYSGSVVDKNYKLLKIFSNFLIGFFNEVNFDNYAFRFHFNGRKIYKQIDEVFFNAQLACLKQKDFSRSVSTSSPANLKTSSIFHDRATTIKLNVLLSVYKSFLISATRNETESHIGTSSGIHTGTEGCSASLLQIFIDNCIRIENMILILLNKRPQTEKQKTLKKYKFKTFHKVYRTFHAQYNLNDVKYKHFFWKLTNLASAGSGKPGTNVNTFGTIDNCLYAFRVSILFLLKLLKVLVKIFINSENFQQCTSSTLQTPSPPPQQLLQPSQKQQQQQQQLKSKAIGKGLKTTKKKLMSYFLVYGDHDLLIEFNSIDWNGLLSSKVLDKLV